jgi:acyl dehydratase
VDPEAVDLRPRRRRVRRRARTVGVIGATGREPDFQLSIAVSPQQALLYRMCGDRNPLHSDPEFAAAAGFPRPILHGLCTYGMTCKAMVDALLDEDTTRVASYGARFAGVVFPGETLKASV